MGSYFRGMSKQEWERVLPNLWSHLDGEIDSVLKFSYDALCDEDKILFLHIACFFNNEEIKKVEAHLANKFLDVRQRLNVLAEKSLISLVSSFDWERIRMHSLLVKLGEEIVYKSYREFLVDDKDIRQVLSDPTAITANVVGIHFRDPVNRCNLIVNERAFEGMSNLQFLRFNPGMTNHYDCSHNHDKRDCAYPNMASLLGCLKHISPKLQLLHWEYSPMTCLPFIVNLEFLVELIMPNSKLVKLWEGIKLLRNLKWINLSDSRDLNELPNLSTATNLQELDLTNCSSLVELPSSIGNATNLQVLDLSGCSSLVGLPSSIGNAINLQNLNLWKCFSLVELPSSIGNLPRLTSINLEGCSMLEVLPTNINLKSLEDLNLTNCWSLKRFPEISTNIKRLKLNGTAIEEVPSSIRLWSRLDDLELNEMQNLVSLPQLPDSLEFLDAENCKSLERLYCSFNNPYIRLNFRNCFKLNQDARNVIIQTSTTSKFSVLPGGEVPACFTYRAPGNSVTVELNEKPLRTSTKFKACILFVNTCKDEFHDWVSCGVYCIIKSKQNEDKWSSRELHPMMTEHLYIFDVEAEEVTSTELVFEFKLYCHTDCDTDTDSDSDSDTDTDTVPYKIKECGILQHLDLQVDEDESPLARKIKKKKSMMRRR